MSNSKKGKTLNPFLILFSVVVVCAILSYFVSPGAFERTVFDGKTIVVPGSYHSVGRTPVSFLMFFVLYQMVLLVQQVLCFWLC